ncbi:MAG: hypothetical protein ABSA21_07245 [Candidatus Limnocylindrales bacterium]
MGARTDAARAEVVARRQLLLDEVVRLEAAGRSAVDIPAKIRRAPGKTAAVAAGAAFLVLGGPRRTYRAIRRAVLGPRADLPKSMLPKEIDKALRSLGDDGAQVRGLLEREFAGYLEKSRPEREARNLKGTISELGGNILRPVSTEAGKRLAKQLFSPDAGGFAAATERIRARREARKAEHLSDAAGTPESDSSSGRERRLGRRRNRLRPR